MVMVHNVIIFSKFGVRQSLLFSLSQKITPLIVALNALLKKPSVFTGFSSITSTLLFSDFVKVFFSQFLSQSSGLIGISAIFQNSSPLASYSFERD